MREILAGIFTWGSTYADRPWDLNGYAIRFDGCTVLVDPPAPGEDDWPSFDVMKPIANIVLTNRDQVRDAELFRTRCGARLVASADEVTQLAPIAIDEALGEGDLIAGALRVIHLPGKSAGEIGLYFDPAHHAVSREMGGILLLGDAIIGNPPGALSLIPEPKLDVALPDSLELDPESVAAIIRVAGGNFRLLGRLLTQAERILEINGLTRVNTSVIDAVRESLVIGQLYSFNSGSFLKVTSCRKNSKFCERFSESRFPSKLFSQKYLAKGMLFARIFANCAFAHVR